MNTSIAITKILVLCFLIIVNKAFHKSFVVASWMKFNKWGDRDCQIAMH